LICPASMSTINDFSMYLIPKKAAPVCPPCQSCSLPSVFEDDDEDDFELEIRTNKVMKNMIFRIKLCSCPKTVSPKFFSSNYLRFLTLSRKSSLSPTDSLHSGISDF
ncbi:hypothetical protein PSTT_00576, partial [Puccinia striiformis]